MAQTRTKNLTAHGEPRRALLRTSRAIQRLDRIEPGKVRRSGRAFLLSESDRLQWVVPLQFKRTLQRTLWKIPDHLVPGGFFRVSTRIFQVDFLLRRF